jgi:hypothetical protein
MPPKKKTYSSTEMPTEVSITTDVPTETLIKTKLKTPRKSTKSKEIEIKNEDVKSESIPVKNKKITTVKKKKDDEDNKKKIEEILPEKKVKQIKKKIIKPIEIDSKEIANMKNRYYELVEEKSNKTKEIDILNTKIDELLKEMLQYYQNKDHNKDGKELDNILESNNTKEKKIITKIEPTIKDSDTTNDASDTDDDDATPTEPLKKSKTKPKPKFTKKTNFENDTESDSD